MNMIYVIILLNLVPIYSDDKTGNKSVEEDIMILCHDKQQIVQSCYYTHREDDIITVDASKTKFSPNTIFFIDTSCKGQLDVRQACSVEAAATSNPDRPVAVLFTGPVSVSVLRTSPSWEVLNYRNVNFFRLNLTSFFYKTPLEGLLAHERRCVLHRLHEVVIFVTLYKFGGVYVDLNMMLVRSLPRLKNYGAIVDEYTLGIGLLALSKNGVGKEITRSILRRYVINAMNDYWGAKGQDILNEEVKKLCFKALRRPKTEASCGGFKIYDQSYFYPIRSNAWLNYFVYSYSHPPIGPYSFYIWNVNSYNRTLYLNSMYGRLTRKHCPLNKNITSGLIRLFVSSLGIETTEPSEVPEET